MILFVVGRWLGGVVSGKGIDWSGNRRKKERKQVVKRLRDIEVLLERDDEVGTQDKNGRVERERVDGMLVLHGTFLRRFVEGDGFGLRGGEGWKEMWIEDLRKVEDGRVEKEVKRRTVDRMWRIWKMSGN
jgi:hypothetical protein